MSARPVRISDVAIRFRGAVYSLPRPNRHHHVLRHIVETTGASHVDMLADDQGFLDEAGHYLTREQALAVALRSGQVRMPADVRCGELFSEDLW